MFSLTVIHKDGPLRVREYAQAEVTIGRVPGNDLVLPGANISKRHARILYNEARGSFVVIDNKSTNGTTINGERINNPYDLQPGDKIYIGDFIIEVNAGSANKRERTITGKHPQRPGRSPAPARGAPHRDGPGDAFPATMDDAETAGSDDPLADLDDWGEAGSASRVVDTWEMGAGHDLKGADGWSRTEPQPDDEWAEASGEFGDPEIPSPGSSMHRVADVKDAASGKRHDATARPQRKPSDSSRPAADSGDASVRECLQRYVDIDEETRRKANAPQCKCGVCLLCQSKLALAHTEDVSGGSAGRR